MRIIGKFSSFVFLVFIAAGAFFLRLEAVNKLPPDFYEDDYLLAAQEIATLLKYDYRLLLERNYHPEHFQLAKILFGAVLLPLTPAGVYPETPIVVPEEGTALPQPHLTCVRDKCDSQYC
jgi:hypothetical protein